MKVNLWSMAIFVAVLGLHTSVVAQESASVPLMADAGPVTIVTGIYEALNAGDVDGAMTMVADDAVLTLVPAPPGTSGAFVGKDEIRSWYEGLVADGGRASFENASTSEHAASMTLVWSSETFRGLGVATISFHGAAVVQGGLLKSLSWVFTPETVQKLAELAAPSPTASVEVISRGSALPAGANGITFDAEDRLLIATVGNNTITVMDPESGEILEVLGLDAGVTRPDDLTFGPDGSLYWTSILTGEVGRLTPEGVKETVAQLSPGVNPIAFSEVGRLFVAQCIFGDDLIELDPTGRREPRLIAADLAPCALNAMDFGPDGYLYGPRPFHGVVVRVDVDSGRFITVADGFMEPVAAKFDASGDLYVVDAAAGEVVRLDLASGERVVVASLPPGLDNLAFDSRGRLYVSSFVEGNIVEVLEGGVVRTVTPGGMASPGGLAVVQTDEGESVFVADIASLREYDGETGETLNVSTDLAFPATVTLAGETFVATSWPANAVQVWDPVSGEMLAHYGDFAVPIHAVRYQEDLIVSELGTGSIVRVIGGDPDVRETLPGEFAVPAGLLANGGNLWASDWATGLVWQLAREGEFLAEPMVVAAELNHPEGLALASNGELLVIESGAGRLSAIDTETGSVRTVAEGLELGLMQPDSPPTLFFNGVDVGPSGNIYVTGDAARVLYRIVPGS